MAELLGLLTPVVDRLTLARRFRATRAGGMVRKPPGLVGGHRSGYTRGVNVQSSVRLACRIIFAICTAAPITGCAGQAVSPTDQTLIREADQLHARLAPALVENVDPRLRRYFEQLAGRITTAARELDQQGVIQSKDDGSKAWMFGKEMDFHLTDGQLPNLYTSGGRHVYIYDGLFQQCKNEDELASLLCHAYAHVYARHVQKELKRDTSLGEEEALLRPFVYLNFTPAHERTAAGIAFDIYLKAGWDPARFGEVYDRLAAEDSSGVTFDIALLRELAKPPLPPPAAARDWAQPPVADDARFAQLQAETKAAAASAPRNERAELLLSALSSCLGPAEGPIQARARQQLFPPPQGPSENKWNKGLQGAR